MLLTKGLSFMPAFEAVLNQAKKLKKGHRILIFAGTLLVLGASLLWFIYLPKAEKIARVKKECSTLRENINRGVIKTKNLPKLEEEYGILEEKYRKAGNLLPNEKEIPNLLTELSNLGINSKLEFLLFSPQTETQMDSYAEINVSLDLRGRYQDVALFFHKVRHMKRIVDISDVSMKPLGPGGAQLVSKPILKATCKAKTYRFIGKVPKPEKWWQVFDRTKEH